MKLRHLDLHDYFNDGRPLEGSVTFQDSHGNETKLKLAPEHMQGILAVVAEALVQSARELAENLTANIITDAGHRLEAPRDNA